MYPALNILRQFRRMRAVQSRNIYFLTFGGGVSSAS
jgi:hypothetical protein